jgi:hypothetical protein
MRDAELSACWTAACSMSLRLAVQVPRLGRRGGRHGPQQRCGGNVLLARSRRRIRVVDVEIGINAVAGLYA